MNTIRNPWKNPIKRISILTVITLFAVAVSFVGCGDDDDADKETSFIENNGGTLWKFAEEILGTTLYLRVNQSESDPFEIWLKMPPATCFVHESLDDSASPEILENTKNTLKVKVEDNDREYTIVTLNVAGGFLTITSEFYEDGALQEDETIILSSSSDNVSELDMCA